ncbi:hypothetical protein Ahy_B06g079775 isoform B [Arachis hypogaea]|uniref:Uncharacterized protein n=1 Tax=Arachis hypogaea TaxID=3818 RepID=A0A444YG41_ARAHY|nr:hypothetical protein Ahy_B06g079775 isoform B [Arachis hypogaea]
MAFIADVSFFDFDQGDTLDYLGIQGLHLAGSQGVLVIAICQALLMAHCNIILLYIVYYDAWI